MFLKKFLHYLNPLNLFRKSEGDGLNLRMMHGINKISFFAFLVCLAVMLYRWLLRGRLLALLKEPSEEELPVLAPCLKLEVAEQRRLHVEPQ